MLDTHAGSGFYDLKDEKSLKTQESSAGISQLLNALATASLAQQGLASREALSREALSRETASQETALHKQAEFVLSQSRPELELMAQLADPNELGCIIEYLKIIARINMPPDNAGQAAADIDYKILAANLRHYPGSPFIVNALLRPQDKLIAAELHPAEAAALRRRFYDRKNIMVHQRDGFEALSALWPPPEKRGLVLIDPPYEKPDDYDRITQALQSLVKKWPAAMAMVWYPIKDRPTLWQFQEKLAHIDKAEILCAEFIYQKEIRHDRLNGCGLILLKPPFGFSYKLQSVFAFLHAALATEAAHTTIKPIKSLA